MASETTGNGFYPLVGIFDTWYMLQTITQLFLSAEVAPFYDFEEQIRVKSTSRASENSPFGSKKSPFPSKNREKNCLSKFDL